MPPPSTIQARELLLVDDDSGHCELIRRHLKRNGLTHRIEIVADAEAAWQHLLDCDLRHQIPALCLLDIDLPGSFDGKELLRRVKLQPRLRLMPIVMLSASDNPLQIHDCYALGCNLYLTKTSHGLSEVLEWLAQCLEMVQVV